MKHTFTKLLSLVLVLVLCIGTLAACGGGNDGNTEKGGTIWVGNTAPTTGAMAKYATFNVGLQAAFDVYNKAGGFNGRSVQLKHYDDGSEASNTATLLEDLIHEDEVFAIVGHVGSYAVDATLETLIDEEVPMIYAAAGNSELYNDNADTLGERGIFPVQPINEDEGRMLILRAFAPIEKGGFAAKKVGVIYNSNEASRALYSGIQKELDTLPEEYRNNVIPQEVTTSDFSAAANALKAEGCDLVIVTVISDDFFTCLTAMANIDFKCSVLTTYNNSSVADFNDGNSKLQKQYYDIFSTMNIFSQAWLDITSTEYTYKADTPLYGAYKALARVYEKDENGKNVEVGVKGFTEEYWHVAENIYDYVATTDPTKAMAMSYNAYALAGYIAGDFFCQALEKLEESGEELTRENLVEILESNEFKVCMSSSLSYANGMRTGVQQFALTWMFDTYNLPEGEGKTNDHVATSITTHGLMSIEEYRALLNK